MAESTSDPVEQTRSYLPARGERALVVGQTGSGKTTFVRWMLPRLADVPIVVYDTKEEPKFDALPNMAIASSWAGVLDHADNDAIDHIVFRPPLASLTQPEELDNYLLRHYHDLRGVAAYIDELYTFHNAGRSGPGLTALYTRGRSRGITTIASTQRPAWVSRFALSEAQLFYIFRLNLKDDRKRISDASGMPDEYRNPDRHWFWHFRAGDEQPQLIRPVPVENHVNEDYTDIATETAPDAEPAKATDDIGHVWL